MIKFVMKQPISLIVMIILFQAILKIGYSQQIKEQLQYDYSFKQLKSGKVCKLFPKKKLKGITKYDSIGRVKEKTSFGEYWQPFENDSSSFYRPIILDSETNFTKRYYSYVNDSLVDKIEQWQFIEQKKSYLISKLIYEYDSTWAMVSLTKLDYNNTIWSKINYIKEDDYSKSPVFLSFKNCTGEEQTPEYYSGRFVVLDSDNKPIESFIYFDSDLIFLSSIYYSNNPAKNEVKLTYHKNRNDLWEIETKNYNSKNKIIEIITIDPRNQIDSRVLFHYSKNGLLKKKEYFTNNRLTSISKYKYVYYKDLK